MGIYDRDYMHRQSSRNEMSGGQALFVIIVVNVIFFIFQDRIGTDFVLKTGGTFSLQTVMQLFTAGFMHMDFWHLLFNMWGLYIFGKLVTPYLNGKKFFLLYIAGVLAGNLLFIAFNWSNQNYLLGASGAVCAVMAAAATLEPDRKFVMLLMPFAPLKTTTLVICYTILEFLFSFNRGSNIAHLAHLGGFIGGYIAMRITFGSNLPWDPLKKIFKSIPKPEFKMPSQPKNASVEDADKTRVSSQELDALLNKLSTSGINSLTEYEQARLRKARRQMRGEE